MPPSSSPSLEGKGTGWCTAGKSTAETQIESGDFYVYYTYDKNNQPTQPRIAIRMQDDKIAEVRGIMQHQSLEPQMNDVLEKKLREFGPEADTYKKKSADMKLLTVIENKTKTNQPLTKADLLFLYEVDGTIEGFGYEKDPRVEELRDQRNCREDAPIVLGCAPNEIAWDSKDNITEITKVYIGPLFDGVFQTNLEHIYTSFPEGKLNKYHVEIRGKTTEELKAEMKEKNIGLYSYAEDLLNSKDFITSKTIEGIDLVRLTVADLGFSSGATTEQIYTKAQGFGLELCPAETGPHFRLVYEGKEYIAVGMKQIADRGGRPGVFNLYGDGAKLGLGARSALPSYRGDSYGRFVFRLRKGNLNT